MDHFCGWCFCICAQISVCPCILKKTVSVNFQPSRGPWASQLDLRKPKFSVLCPIFKTSYQEAMSSDFRLNSATFFVISSSFHKKMFRTPKSLGPFLGMTQVNRKFQNLYIIILKHFQRFAFDRFLHFLQNAPC